MPLKNLRKFTNIVVKAATIVHIPAMELIVVKLMTYKITVREVSNTPGVGFPLKSGCIILCSIVLFMSD